FSTIYWAAKSLRYNLPTMQDLYLMVALQGHNALFTRNTASSLQFELALTKFIFVAAPSAKTILCLELTHVMVADVY
ncbi:hypothetical protein BV25DRAFT_1772692, partial [Artomyces pyxidatus]